MGLDITAYKNLIKIENPQRDGDGELIDYDEAFEPGASAKWSESAFPGRAEGLDISCVYQYQDAFDFRAGSYSGYNRWRDQLEEFGQGRAFQELINFADNEGVIGPVVSKKLACDFQALEPAARFYAENINSEWFIEQYLNWKKAFEMASENGAVEFC